MQKENAEGIITNDELYKLIALVKAGDKSAMNEIIELYSEEIQDACKYMKMSKEESFQSIVVEFLELIVNNEVGKKSI